MSMSGFDDDNNDNKSEGKEMSDLQEFILAEKQISDFQAQMRDLNDMCWDKCVEKPGVKLEGKTRTCLTNCVDRFIDVSLVITNRFAGSIQKFMES